MNAFKKAIAYLLQAIGALTFLAGVANLYLSFTDKWIMAGGFTCYVVGTLVIESIDMIDTRKDSIGDFTEKRKDRLTGFNARLQDALEEQKKAQSKAGNKTKQP